jgi:hypothetical protein
MKYLQATILILITGLMVRGQTPADSLTGTVTFITSQNVYVSFPSTRTITTGDTLYIRINNRIIPALKVTSLSSTSSVCTPLPGVQLKLSDKLVHNPSGATGQKQVPVEIPPPAPDAVPPPSGVPGSPVTPRSLPESKTATPTTDTTKQAKGGTAARLQSIHGYTSITSYSDFATISAVDAFRLKYTLSLNALNLGNTGLSAECYINFLYRDRQWSEIKSNIYNALKIYDISLSYEFNSHFKIRAGRHINPVLSNVGAIDGLQFEMKFKPFTFGIFAGSRPDYTDYSFNFSLPQFGAYAGHELSTKKGFMLTTLAYVLQTSSGKTDRSFLYLQHTNALLPKLSFYGNLEVDLYGETFNSADSTYNRDNRPALTNLYLSLSYRVIRQLTVSFSYSLRHNVIYYQTYRDFLTQLLPNPALQGYALNVTCRPGKKFTIGATGAVRFENADPQKTLNFYGYISYADIPGIHIIPTITYSWIQTSYVFGNNISAGIARDFLKGKLYSSLNYRYMGYRFRDGEPDLPQNIAEASLTWRIWKRISLSFYYEGTFEKIYNFNRIYCQLMAGF